MRWTLFLPLLLLSAFLSGASKPLEESSYKSRNPELGIVYRPVDWDRQQWEEVFRDPAPPASWAVMPIGSESCSALSSWWLDGVRNKGLRPAILLDPFLTKQQIEKTIDCAVTLGVKRAILDEYISYQNKNLGRNLCTVISEVRDIYQNAKRKYPGLQVDIDDNWQTWIVDLGKGQKGSSCGKYPLFEFDQTGISVLSKYGNPATGTCDHPTAQEMREQLIDLKPTVRDYAKSGKTFVWQLNQHWYPGGAEVLQVFREMKKAYGWNRFFLFGPTTDDALLGSWGYSSQGVRQGCADSGYQWYLPARDYLIKMSEGAKSRIVANVPSLALRGTYVNITGKILSGTQGVAVDNLQLRITAPPGSVQRFQQDLIAPPKARLALVGVRVNLELPHKVTGSANFQWERVHFGRSGSNNNLILNSEFNNGLNDWFVISTTPVTVGTNGSENFLQANSSSNQSISITSTPAFVTPGRSYTVRFDSRIFNEARNNGYFFVSWYTTKEIQRDRLFMTFPDARTVISTSTPANGNFAFQWRSDEPGIFTVSPFFPGSPALQPAIKNNRIEIQ